MHGCSSYMGCRRGVVRGTCTKIWPPQRPWGIVPEGNKRLAGALLLGTGQVQSMDRICRISFAGIFVTQSLPPPYDGASACYSCPPLLLPLSFALSAFPSLCPGPCLLDESFPPPCATSNVRHRHRRHRHRCPNRKQTIPRPGAFDKHHGLAQAVQLPQAGQP